MAGGGAVRVLVTGAAGYIGSVVVDGLVDAGHQVIALDNLAHGHRKAVNASAEFHQIDLVDAPGVLEVLEAGRVDAVVHMAAEALIDESVRDPGKFYRTNVQGGQNLLDGMMHCGVRRIIFSSTAAVYGEQQSMPISEDVPKMPVNSYGESKLAFERMLHWYRRAHGLSYVTLRYFNACGATGARGESHQPETHLIPIVCDVAMGLRDAVRLYGTDYGTPDGTCIRDYVHVSDIADAHILCLDRVDQIGERAYNLGTGTGHSNCAVVDTVRRLTGREVQVIPDARRLGDPAVLVASPQRIKRELGWNPAISDLESIVRSAWEWRQAHPQGYHL
jgi:UDP-glucose 4-epimerase